MCVFGGICFSSARYFFSFSFLRLVSFASRRSKLLARSPTWLANFFLEGSHVATLRGFQMSEGYLISSYEMELSLIIFLG